ncbi:hypothetical protein DMENIID0001_130810 [Sergentomyia squamirostris]
MKKYLILILQISTVLAEKGASVEDVKRIPVFLGILNAGREVKIGEECRKDVSLTLESILQKNIWALKMLDASGDVEHRFIWQNVFWLGSREFCSGINAHIPVYLEKKSPDILKLVNESPPFEVDYRLIYGDIKSKYQILYEKIMSTILHLGLCVPISCSNDDILIMSRKYFEESTVSPFFDMSVNFTRVKNPEFDFKILHHWIFKLTAGIIFGIFLAHVLGSTVKERTSIGISRYFRHFSMKDQYQRLTSSRIDLKIVYSLNFYRAVCSTWVTAAHVYLFNFLVVDSAPMNTWRIKLFYNKFIQRAAIILDMFFLMSGFVLVYNFLKDQDLCERIRRNSLQQNIKLLLKRIIHRYTRFIPTLVATLIFCRITYIISDLTFYRDMRHNIAIDSSRWIWNIFFLQNLVPFREMAMPWTWSMACDMQCFIIFQALLFIYVKNSVWGIRLFLGLVTIFIGLSFRSMYHAMSFECFDLSYVGLMCVIDKFYMKTHYRAIVYACGIALGYLAYRALGKNVQIPKILRITFWSAVLISWGILLFLSESYVPEFLLPWFFTFGRMGFALLNGGVFLFAQWGYCNWINDISRMPLFMKSSKLSFGLYIFHPIFIYIFLTGHNDVVFSSVVILICYTTVSTILTYYFSIVFYIFVEAPFIDLFDDLMKMKQKKGKE